MVRVSFDTNIVIYSELEPGTPKGMRAQTLISRGALDGVVPLQVYGEFLRFVQRRLPQALPAAITRAAELRAVFAAPALTAPVFAAAADIALKHGLQFWDAVICAASIDAGAHVLLSEDMQDGRVIENLKILNPFNADNDAALDQMLAP